MYTAKVERALLHGHSTVSALSLTLVAHWICQPRLQCSGSSQLLLQLILAQRLDIAVPTNVFLADEDIRHAALVGDLLQRILQRGSIICCTKQSATVNLTLALFSEHTDLIQLPDLELCSGLAQQLLGGLAVRTVALAEDGDGVVVNERLRFLFGSHDALWGSRGEESLRDGEEAGENLGGIELLVRSCVRCERCICV